VAPEADFIDNIQTAADSKATSWRRYWATVAAAGAILSAIGGLEAGLSARAPNTSGFEPADLSKAELTSSEFGAKIDNLTPGPVDLNNPGVVEITDPSTGRKQLIINEGKLELPAYDEGQTLPSRYHPEIVKTLGTDDSVVVIQQVVEDAAVTKDTGGFVDPAGYNETIANIYFSNVKMVIFIRYYHGIPLPGVSVIKPL